MEKMLGKRKKQIWKLFNLRRGPGNYLLAEMKEADFDKYVSGIILEVDGQQISFVETPVIPIVIFRGVKPGKEKLPFEK